MPKLVIKKCIECDKQFLADSRPHHKRCSMQCRSISKSWRAAISKSAKTRTGSKNPHWRGGRIRSGKYIYRYAPSHPATTQNGYVFEHRLVMEKKIGRFLAARERVHHKNHITTDNRKSNLYLFKNTSEHSIFHNKKRWHPELLVKL